MIETVLGTLVAWLIASAFVGADSSWAGEGLALAASFVVTAGILHAVQAGSILRAVIRLRRGLGPPRLPLRWFAPLLQLATFGFLCQSGWVRPLIGEAPGFFLELAWLMAPWFLAHLVSLPFRRRVEIAMRRLEWRWPSFLHFHLRLLILPTGLFLGLAGLERGVAAVWSSPGATLAYPSLAAGMVLVGMGILFVLAPVLLRLALPTHSLPSGPLRRRFEELSSEQGFRFRDIRVIESDNHVVNAALVGVIAPLRYVFVTDGILKRLDEEDLLGVFAHEMGHSKRWHLVLNLIMLVSFIALLSVFGTMLVRQFGESGFIEFGLPILAMPAFFLFFFFPTARTFETEADVYAGEALGGPDRIRQALGVIGRLFPAKSDRGGFLHPSISNRVAYLDRYFKDADIRLAFRAQGVRVRARVMALAFVAVLAWTAVLPGEIARGRVMTAVEAAYREDDESKAKAALEELETAVRAGVIEDEDYRLRMSLWQVISTEYQDRADYEGAETWLQDMRDARPYFEDPVSRYSAAIILAQQAAARGKWLTLSEELDEAEPWLAKLEKVPGMAENESLAQERRDIGFLRRGVQALELMGVLPMVRAHEVLPELPERPDYDRMTALRAAAEAELENRGLSVPDRAPKARFSALDPSPEGPARNERWRLDFLRSLTRDLGFEKGP